MSSPAPSLPRGRPPKRHSDASTPGGNPLSPGTSSKRPYQIQQSQLHQSQTQDSINQNNTNQQQDKESPAPSEDEEEEDTALDDALDESRKDKALRENALVAAFDEEQRNRLYAWRNSGIPKPVFKRFINHVLQQSVGDQVAVSFMGISKIFVTQIVQLALVVQSEWNESGPLTPDHLREAWRRFQHARHRPTTGGNRRSLFVR